MSSKTIKINANDNNDMYLPMKFLTAIELFDKDISANYISQNNKDFLEETSLIKEFHINDMFIMLSSSLNRQCGFFPLLIKFLISD